MFPIKHQLSTGIQIILNPYWINESDPLAVDYNRELVVAGINAISGSTGVIIRTAKRWGETNPPTSLYDNYYKPFDFSDFTYLSGLLSGDDAFLGRTFIGEPGYTYTISEVRLRGRVFVKRPGSGSAAYQETGLQTNVYKASFSDYTDHAEIASVADGAAIYNATQIGNYEYTVLDRSTYDGYQVKIFDFTKLIPLDDVLISTDAIPINLILGFAFSTSSYIELSEKPYIYEVDFKVKKELSNTNILTHNGIPVTHNGEVITVENIVTEGGEPVTHNGDIIYL